MDNGKCHGSFIAGVCAKGSNASLELQNGYCKTCWNKEQKDYADVLLATQEPKGKKELGKCRNLACARGSNASTELNNGFCKPCWTKYQKMYHAALQAEKRAVSAAAGQGQQAVAVVGKPQHAQQVVGAAAVAVAVAGRTVPAAAAKATKAAASNSKGSVAAASAAQHAAGAAVRQQTPANVPGPHQQRPSSAGSRESSSKAPVPPRAKTPPAGHQAPTPAPGTVARGNGPAANTRAATKEKIPTAVRNQVWLKYMGNTAFGRCPCCGVHEISLVQSGGFECGHVQAEANGGSTHLGNLIPVCKSCNLGMGRSNMFDYVRQYYPHRYQALTALHTAVVTSLLGQLRL